ncbi:MAG: NTP transferase domain-containing protein [Clostridia bacterium]|nr:NTP transferase domain-containing protein [Clostridia bacterium]
MSDKSPILLIMAAGMGSRYGGLKQMDPVGPEGETILDYSVFDARRAGFRRVVFLIKHEIEADFRRLVGDRIARHMEVSYAFQEVTSLPEGYAVPEGRVKPYGTGHAVLCCRDLIDAPFAAINADDYYGPHAFQQAYDALTALRDDEKQRFLMVAYALKNTLTENGYVARGVCEANPDGTLRTIHERTHIIASCDGPLYTEDGETYRRLDPDSPVSMNMWGFTPSLLTALAERFPAFLENDLKRNPVKAEFFLPFVVNDLLEEGKATVRVLRSEDRWWGVTYQADKPQVKAALKALTDQGLYPPALWEA